MCVHCFFFTVNVVIRKNAKKEKNWNQYRKQNIKLTILLPCIYYCQQKTYQALYKYIHIYFISIKYLILKTDPPFVNTLSQIDIIEGENLSVTCTATPGNPSSTTFYWTKVDNVSFRQDGSALQLHNIDRSSSGIYRCIAETIYSNGERGTDSQSMVVNVLCMWSEHNYMIEMTIVFRLIVQNGGNQYKNQ